jgi:hypothetical protein
VVRSSAPPCIDLETGIETSRIQIQQGIPPSSSEIETNANSRGVATPREFTLSPPIEPPCSQYEHNIIHIADHVVYLLWKEFDLADRHRTIADRHRTIADRHRTINEFRLQAIDLTTNHEIWSVSADLSTKVLEVSDGNMILVTISDYTKFAAIDLNSGQIKSTTQVENSDAFIGRPVIAGNIYYNSFASPLPPLAMFVKLISMP